MRLKRILRCYLAYFCKSLLSGAGFLLEYLEGFSGASYLIRCVTVFWGFVKIDSTAFFCLLIDNISFDFT